jgi:hypothetical protein
LNNSQAQNTGNRLNHEMERRQAEKRQRERELAMPLYGGDGPLGNLAIDDDRVVDHVYNHTRSEKRRRSGRGVRRETELLVGSDGEGSAGEEPEAESPTPKYKGNRLQLANIKDMTKVIAGPHVFGSGSSSARKELQSSGSCNSRVGRVNFGMRNLRDRREKAQWARLIHAVNLDYIQHGPEREDVEDQSDILKMIKSRFRMIYGNDSDLTQEMLRNVRTLCVFLTPRFNNGVYGHGGQK